MLKLLNRVFIGNNNDRVIKKLNEQVRLINQLDQSVSQLSDQELQGKTQLFKDRINNGETLDNLLPEAFAVVRETSKRVLGEKHYDVQLLGGIVLHQGKISEMHTGEGKTLVATLPAYLNALSGKGVHIVTINDYLAKRDSEWMSKIYNFLGLTVGCIVHSLSDEERKAEYLCDITYGTNNEFGFDYLRDNMKFHLESMVQREFNFAIVDEVDSILIDEARTPLIISGPTEQNISLYSQIDTIIPLLEAADFELDEKVRAVTLSDKGNINLEAILIQKGILSEGTSLYDIENVSLVHHISQALRAHKLFLKDRDYMVKNGKVLIIDEFTGRALEGRRYSEGLHQAIEAKEKVTINNENQTLASITFQNYFRMYPKLAGMSGSAMTEANELLDIYKLEVIAIPTNIPIKRIDENDVIYATEAEKYDAIIEEIEKAHARKQPILVGTVSIEKSEHLSSLLKKKKIAHNILNARYHEAEAHIIAQAGIPGAITIATNMAGRGTDIKLGGNLSMRINALPEGLNDKEKAKQIQKIKEEIASDKQIVLEAGGLYVIATERHESRRIDNQLRGRSGRQGDPGRSKFFLSLEDDLMRIFAAERMQAILQKLGLNNGEAIHHPMINKALEKAQQKVEARNYDIRKNLLKYDDVANDQRRVIYEQRKDIMLSSDISETIKHIYQEVTENILSMCIPAKSYPEQWNIDSFAVETLRLFNLHLPIKEWVEEEGITHEVIEERLQKNIIDMLNAKESAYGHDIMRTAEKRLYLLILDQLWKDHLLVLDHLRQGINLRAYGQKDPLIEYKREAFMAFETMLSHFQETLVERISHMELTLYETDNGKFISEQKAPFRNIKESRVDPAFTSPNDERITYVDKVHRNQPCPCGSEKKFKHCHGKL
jgi:preprotein translocase subunit SecA